MLSHLWFMGYAPEDIIANIFRVCKNYQMAEYLKLEFIKVRKIPWPVGRAMKTVPSRTGIHGSIALGKRNLFHSMEYFSQNISRVFLEYFHTTENISILWNWTKI